METAFKYFEANEIFPTRAELLEKYKARVKGITPNKPAPEKKKKEVKPKEPDFFKVFNNTAYRTFRPTLKTTQKKVIYLTKEEIKASEMNKMSFMD